MKPGLEGKEGSFQCRIEGHQGTSMLTCLCLQFDFDQLNRCGWDGLNTPTNGACNEDVRVVGLGFGVTMAICVQDLHGVTVDTKENAVEHSHRCQGEGHPFEEAARL